MGKNKIKSVADNQNKTDVKKIRLDEARQKLLNTILVFRNSTSFVKLCIEKDTITCDTKNLQKFNRFAKQGQYMFLIKNRIINNFASFLMNGQRICQLNYYETNIIRVYIIRKGINKRI